jgi:hypothetical protein
VAGTPSDSDTLAIRWLETDAVTRRLALGGSAARDRTREPHPARRAGLTEHRLTLALPSFRGRLGAARIFIVETPAVRAPDLGCLPSRSTAGAVD